jgi:hypothetical protein
MKSFVFLCDPPRPLRLIFIRSQSQIAVGRALHPSIKDRLNLIEKEASTCEQNSQDCVLSLCSLFHPCRFGVGPEASFSSIPAK